MYTLLIIAWVRVIGTLFATFGPCKNISVHVFALVAEADWIEEAATSICHRPDIVLKAQSFNVQTFVNPESKVLPLSDYDLWAEPKDAPLTKASQVESHTGRSGRNSNSWQVLEVKRVKQIFGVRVDVDRILFDCGYLHAFNKQPWRDKGWIVSLHLKEFREKELLFW